MKYFVSPLIFIFLFFALVHPGMVLHEKILPREVEQTLFVAFDGIPFSLVQNLHQDGKLADYQKPSTLISVFPSTTTACFTGIFKPLGAEKGPGYDAKFFDWQTYKVKGSLLEAYDIGGSSYKKFFSYMRSSGFEQTVMYTAPMFALRVDLAHLKPSVWNAPDKKSIYFYFGSSDGSAHLDGEEATAELFLEVVDHIENLRREYQRDFGKNLRVVLFSDHGFHWGPLHPIQLSDIDFALKEKGKYLAGDGLKDSDGVVAITWGNISGADFYTMSNRNISKVVDVLMETEGVDLAFYLEDEATIKVYKKGKLREIAGIHFSKDGKKFRYEAKVWDPLNYLGVAAELKKEGKMDAQGFALESDWFAKTSDHEYPDALYRVWDAFFGLTKNPASILLSTKEDYEFGDNLTRFGAKIRGGLLGTHGAISRNSSLAFVMTTDAKIPLPAVVRYDQALTFFK